MKWIIFIVPLLALGCAESKKGPAATTEAVPPNIVLVYADDLGYADLSCYGATAVRTPHLDSLAAHSLRFTQAYSASPVCSPARAALMTGLHPARLQLTNFIYGTRQNDTSRWQPAYFREHLPLSCITMAEYLKRAGYATAIFGKWHLSDNIKDTPFEPKYQGFDRQVGGKGSEGGAFYPAYSQHPHTANIAGKEGDYMTDKLTDMAISYADSMKHENKPFFLYLPHYSVHIPLKAKEEDLAATADGLDTSMSHVYAAMVHNLDQNTGRLIASLKANGQWDNTIFIFTSDNGGLNVPEGEPRPTRNGRLREGKGSLYEGGIRVPLIISWPGHSPQQYHFPLSTMDMLPTLLDVLGQKPDTLLDGRSVASLQGQPDREFFWYYPHFSNQHPGISMGAALRQGRWKAIYRFGDAVELYDLQNDEAETTNLAQQPEHQARAQAMMGRVRQLMQEMNAQLPVAKK